MKYYTRAQAIAIVKLLYMFDFSITLGTIDLLDLGSITETHDTCAVSVYRRDDILSCAITPTGSDEVHTFIITD